MDKKVALSTVKSIVRPEFWQPLSQSQRLILVGIGLALIGGFSLAAYLKPSPRGYGTHQQLGLPPCTFRFFLGIPCPSCGMTTSFSHFVRGEFVEAADANSAGFFLASCCLVLVPWSFVSAGTGRAIFVRDLWSAYLWLLILLCGASIVHWLSLIF